MKLTAYKAIVEWDYVAAKMKKDLQEVRVDGFGGGIEWNLEKREWSNERKNSKKPYIT